MPDDLVDTKHGVISIAEHIVSVREQLEELKQQREQQAEELRQERWHRHRLGVLCAAIQHYGWDYLTNSESSAVDAADRAHGPLERGPSYEEVTRRADENSKALAEAVEWQRETREDIAELVRAARDIDEIGILADSDKEYVHARGRLSYALKPFESVK